MVERKWGMAALGSVFTAIVQVLRKAEVIPLQGLRYMEGIPGKYLL